MVKFSVKELLLDLRQQVGSIDAKLDLKADRERVHQLAADLAAIRLERAAENSVRVNLVEEFRVAQGQIDSLLSWRNRILGAWGFVVLVIGVVTAKVAGAL